VRRHRRLGSTPAQSAEWSLSGTFTHRVVGLPGERVSGRGGTITLDGERVDEPYVARERRGEH
jgi:hypothetical protein